MLDAHPDMAIPPETGFLVLGPKLSGKGKALRQEFFHAVIHYPPGMSGWRDFGIPEATYGSELEKINPFTVADGYRAFYRLYASRFGKPRWGDKTPAYCFHQRAIEKVLPEARFIHVIRDGRDVALSLRPLWFSPGNDLAVQAAYWSRHVLAARREGPLCRYYHEVRYEDLVMAPEKTLQRVCDFIDLEYDAAMLQYYERAPERLLEHKTRIRSDGSIVVSQEQRYSQQYLTTRMPDPSRIHAWKQSLSEQEQLEFEAEAGNLLHNLGYEIHPLTMKRLPFSAALDS